MLLSCDDRPEEADQPLDPDRTPPEALSRRASTVRREDRADVERNTYFVINNYAGPAAEKAILRYVIEEVLAPTAAEPGATTEVAFAELPLQMLAVGGPAVKGSDRVTALEKALYRLLLVGAIEDYGKDYSTKKFVVRRSPAPPPSFYPALCRYLGQYALPDMGAQYMPAPRQADWSGAAYACGCALIDFVYATVEKQRRRAMKDMLEAARAAAAEAGNGGDDRRLREELLAYLEVSQYTKPVRELSGRIRPSEWVALLEEAAGTEAATKLLGACRRQLEATPDHPGLLLVAGLCRVGGADERQAAGDVTSAFRSLGRYRPVDRVVVAQRVLAHTQARAREKTDAVLCAILEADCSREVARFCYGAEVPYGAAHERAVCRLAEGLIEATRAGWKQ